MLDQEPTWQKSSFSSSNPNSDCVELAAGPGGTVLLRESDHPAAVLSGTPTAVRMLLTHLKSGAVGPPTAGSRRGSGRCG
ncbi:DUF397 domain-containing protein [Streptomyces sp. NPDC048172]|uniref:DUF397 domain-containing protein n=1 Tax=Streptomyces sp. NPDC048172 TaxID=3365505 RepID=UPI00371B2937